VAGVLGIEHDAHRPSIFPNPDKFDPPVFESQPPPYSFIAFGGGQRLCAGIEFTWVRRFRWCLCCKANTFVRDLMLTPLHGLPIKLEHKDDASPCTSSF
jgi:cytochrome P450